MTTLKQYIDEHDLSPEGFGEIEDELDSLVRVMSDGVDVNGGENEIVRIYPDGLDMSPLRLGIYNPGNGTSVVRDFSNEDSD
jgi:hypothetical protein